MKLWRRAAGLLKDQNSIWACNFSKRSPLRNPDLHEAVIKATSHNDTRLDYTNSHRVFAWLRMSPSYLQPLICSISLRMEKTRSWVVALKGLMLLHGVFCCKVPAVQKIGRLPFDLSTFKDGYSETHKTWAHNAFIRAYYSFLDHKSTFIFLHAQELKALEKEMPHLHQQRQHTLNQELLWLQSLQNLLDMLLQIRPQTDEMIGVLILEAMDCIIIEIMDVYSRIGNGISRIMMKIHSSGKEEAEMALNILRRTTVQDHQLVSYFEFCKDIGVINASESPRFHQVAEEDIQELENRVNGMSEIKYPVPQMEEEEEEEKEAITVKMIESGSHQRKDSTSSLQTIITDEWEVFDESPNKSNLQTAIYDPFAAALSPPQVQQQQQHRKIDDLPDLIIF